MGAGQSWTGKRVDAWQTVNSQTRKHSHKSSDGSRGKERVKKHHEFGKGV
jgi:hypothetical protein